MIFFKIRRDRKPVYLYNQISEKFAVNTRLGLNNGIRETRRFKSTLGTQSFTPRSIKQWNSLPVEIRTESSNDKFRSKLRAWVKLNFWSPTLQLLYSIFQHQTTVHDFPMVRLHYYTVKCDRLVKLAGTSLYWRLLNLWLMVISNVVRQCSTRPEWFSTDSALVGRYLNLSMGWVCLRILWLWENLAMFWLRMRMTWVGRGLVGSWRF